MKRFMFRMLLAAACTAPADDPAATAGSEALSPTFTASESIGTVARVELATPEAAEAWIEVSEAGGPTRRFPAKSDEAGTSHRAVLAGLAAATDYTWRAVARLDDGTELASEPEVFSTAPPPLWLPTLTTVLPAPDPWEPGFVLTTVIGDSPGAGIFDRQGRWVWWWQAQEGAMPCQARMAVDGESILLMVVDKEFTDDISALVRVGFDGETSWSRHIGMGHHDFVERENGTIGYLAFDIQPYRGVVTVGDALVLLDPGTDAEVKLWTTWDNFVPNAEEDDGFYPFGDDWSHGNGLTRDPVTGDWFVSLHNLDTIVRLTTDGELVWRLGGALSDFTLTGGDGFSHQHSPVLTDRGVLLFDNNSPDPDALYSRAAEYALDEDAKTYAEAWSYDGGKGLFSAYMGAVEREPDGRTLIGWGSGGRITELDADGVLDWQIEAPIGSPFGFTHPVATLGEIVE